MAHFYNYRITGSFYSLSLAAVKLSSTTGFEIKMKGSCAIRNPSMQRCKQGTHKVWDAPPNKLN